MGKTKKELIEEVSEYLKGLPKEEFERQLEEIRESGSADYLKPFFYNLEEEYFDENK